MSVISKDDATEDGQGSPVSTTDQAALKAGHLMVEISPAGFAEPTEPVPGVPLPASADQAGLDSHHQATIALNVSDVLDLGTEEINGLNALVIDGAQGDAVHLASEPGYAWTRMEISAAEGYQTFQAHNVADHGALSGGEHAEPIYVLVQHDLTVILQSS